MTDEAVTDETAAAAVVPSGFDGVLGQPTAVQTLERALASERLHHAYRFEGPEGVGKERCAFALARALVCETGRGCGRCSACQRATRLSEDPPHVPQHPDVVLVARGLYPPATLGRSSAETSGIGVEQIRRIVLPRVDYPPHEARHLVFIFRAAHELTASAANALLKTLEEPRPGVHFLLVTDQPRRLLDTIRSRTLPIRFGPLTDDTLRTLLSERDLQASDELLSLASGSAARAIDLGDPERVARRRQFVQSILGAVRAPDLGEGVELVAAASPDRDSLRTDLPALAHYFAMRARRHVGARADKAMRCARCHAEVDVALADLHRNLPPALTLETLIARLRRA